MLTDVLSVENEGLAGVRQMRELEGGGGTNVELMPVFLRSFCQHACDAREGGRDTNLEANLAQIAQGSGNVRHRGLELPVGRGWTSMCFCCYGEVRIDLTVASGSLWKVPGQSGSSIRG